MLKYTTCYRDLSYLGIPIIIGQIGTIVMSFTDTLMIGHHSTPELAAASFVNNMFTLVIILGFSGNLVGISINLCKSIQKELFINDTP